MNSLRMLVTLCLLSLSAAVSAGPAADAAGTCLTDSTTGKDRKNLVRWVFLAMAKHPELARLSSATAGDDSASNEQVGVLFTRLIAEDCRKEMAALVAESGPSAISTAFEVLGKVAMQELLSHPDVTSSMGGLEQSVDQARINEVLASPR